MSIMKISIAPLALFALLLAGCSGGGGDDGPLARTEISGVIFDANGDPVRDARVYYEGGGGARETRSNSAGQYVLEDLPAGDLLIKAKVEETAYGQNVARTLSGERTKNHNIAVFPEGQRGHLKGVVEDRDGFLLTGARVFARPTNGNLLSSAYGITDDQGRFSLRDLRSDEEYEVLANASGYGSESDVIVVSDSEDLELRFTLNNAPNPELPAPQNFEAQATTSPNEVTRDARAASAVRAMKAILDKGRPQPKASASRLTAMGNPIEVDLFWDRVDNPGLLGYGLYRGPNSQNLRAIEFIRDPLAEIFADNDPTLVEGRTYTYSITALNTRYPDTSDSESEFSNAADAVTLGDLPLLPVQGTPPTFRWDRALGAEDYAVFIFDEYPRIGVPSRFNTFENRTTGTSYEYNGPALAPGTYYYIVAGFANDDLSRSISPVGQFIVP